MKSKFTLPRVSNHALRSDSLLIDESRSSLEKKLQPDLAKSKVLRVAVDFDNVLHASSKGWHDGSIYDSYVPDAPWGLTWLRKVGAYVIIHSCRLVPRMHMIDGEEVHSPGQQSEVAAFLDKHNMPYDELWTERGKPWAHAYIDDKGYRFNNWATTVKFLRGFSEILKLDPKQPKRHRRAKA